MAEPDAGDHHHEVAELGEILRPHRGVGELTAEGTRFALVPL
jgi:hypothetical protein